ncbi:hypothetical protein ACFL17_04295, partial [Pseudomonadota bacterium]
PDPELAHAALLKENIPHFIHTTHSHTANTNKYHIYIHCEKYTQVDLGGAVAAIVKLLNDNGVPIANVKENGTWSQPWYLPCIKKQGDPFKVFDGAGEPYKIVGDSGYMPIPEFSDFDIDKCFQEIHEGTDYHGSIISAAMHYANKGLPASETAHVLQALLLANQDDHDSQRWKDRFDDIERCCRDAVAKFQSESNLPVKRTLKNKNHDAPIVPLELVHTDDDFGEYIKNIVECTPHRDCPVAALVHGTSNVLASASAYTTIYRDFHSAISVVVGPTQCGKSLTSKTARLYLPPDLLTQFYTGVGTSEGLQDLYRHFELRPDLYFSIDEVGFMFKELKSKASANTLWRDLLELTTNGINTMTTRPLAGNPPGLIKVPLFVLAGGTTEAALVGGITQQEVDEGGVNRSSIFNGNCHTSIKRSPPAQPDERWKERLADIWRTGDDVAVEDRFSPKNIVTFDEAAIVDLHERDEGNLQAGSLRGRHVEIAKKWAVARVIFNDPANPRVSFEVWRWAYELIECSLQYVEFLFDNVLIASEASRMEHDLIKRLEKNDGDMRKADALNIASWNSAGAVKRKQVLAALDNEVEGPVYVYTKPTMAGRKGSRIMLVADES